MDHMQAIWIRDPLAILAEGAERGVVVRQGPDRRAGFPPADKPADCRCRSVRRLPDTWCCPG